MAIFKSMFKKTGYIKVDRSQKRRDRLYRMVCG